MCVACSATPVSPRGPTGVFSRPTRKTKTFQLHQKTKPKRYSSSVVAGAGSGPTGDADLGSIGRGTRPAPTPADGQRARVLRPRDADLGARPAASHCG